MRPLTAKRSFHSTPRLPNSSARSLPQRSSSAGWPGQTTSTESTKSFALEGQETMAPRAATGRSAEAAQAVSSRNSAATECQGPGQGAMGTVYLAEDTQLQRQVALKTPHFEQEPTAELLERFYREARAAATLRHPNICPVYDVGQIDGTHYISMAYIEGHPLSAFIRSAKPQPERQILIIVRKLAQALQEAHDHGIVHRDLKPANIMVDKRNEPIIMDFGLARQLQPKENAHHAKRHAHRHAGLHVARADRRRAGQSRPASDQYSLGVILYEMLTGQLPFRGSLTAVMAQILTKEPTPPSQLRPDLDLRIEALCLKMLAKDPAEPVRVALGGGRENLRSSSALRPRRQPSDRCEAAGTPAASTPPLGTADVATSGIRQSVREVARRGDRQPGRQGPRVAR